MILRTVFGGTLLFAVLCATAQADPQPRLFTGTARHLQTGAHLYTETYREQYDANDRLHHARVDYRDPSGTLLAEKNLDYRAHSYAPAFTFFNHRTGYQEQVHWLADGRVKLRHAHTAPGSAQEKILRVPAPVVADAGFNRYLQDHLPALSRGEELQFHFLNPARLDEFRFSARLEAQTASHLRLLISPANPLLRWLVQPIRLTYDRHSGRLLRYEGLTNISLDGDTTLPARIEYQYDAKPLHYSAHLFED